MRSAPRRVTPLRPSRRSPQRRWAPTAFARAPAGAGAHTPSEFAVFFRVSLAVLAAHLLRRTGLDLSPLDVALAVCTPRACQVRCQTRCAPLVNFYAPSEYLGNFAPLDAPRHLEGVSRCSSSPHEVARPSSVRGSCRPLPATAAEAAAAFAAGLRPASVPTTSFLTTSPACSATNRPGISPGDAPGIHGPAGCSHSSGDTASPRCAAPPDLLDCTPDTVLTTRCPEDAEATSNQPVTPVTTTPRREPPRRRRQTRPKPRSHRFRNPPHRGDRPLHQPKPKQSQHRRTVASTFVGTTPPKKRSPRRPRGPPGVCPRTEVAEATPPRVTTSTEVKTASRLSVPHPPKRAWYSTATASLRRRLQSLEVAVLAGFRFPVRQESNPPGLVWLGPRFAPLSATCSRRSPGLRLRSTPGLPPGSLRGHPPRLRAGRPAPSRVPICQ